MQPFLRVESDNFHVTKNSRKFGSKRALSHRRLDATLKAPSELSPRWGGAPRRIRGIDPMAAVVQTPNQNPQPSKLPTAARCPPCRSYPPSGGYPTATTHLAGSLFALGQHREPLSKKRGCPNSSE